MNDGIIDRPESVEVKHLLVPLSNWFHLHVWLVTDAVIEYVEFWYWQHFVKLLLQVVLFESWKEDSLVVVSLNEGMSRVTIGLDGSNND